ncbi:MAG: hypothetical protein ABL893_12220 [Hyphomicrobium sp.]
MQNLRATLIVAFALLSAAAQTGCGDDAPKPASYVQTKSPSETFKRDVEWLELKQDTAPDAWLIARAQASGEITSLQDSEELRRALEIATRRLGESKRMIANRAAQLERMLEQEGQKDSAIALIIDLTAAIGETGQTEGFGAVTQHYFTMRKSGLSRKLALKEMKLRYGPRS